MPANIIIQLLLTPLKLLQCQSSHILLKQLFCSTCLLTKGIKVHQDLFSMLHHHDSTEKPQYKMETPISRNLPPLILPYPCLLFYQNF